MIVLFEEGLGFLDIVWRGNSAVINTSPHKGSKMIPKIPEGARKGLTLSAGVQG